MMTNPVKNPILKRLLAGIVLLIALTVVGTAIARNGAGPGEPDPAADVLARIGSPRVTALSAVGGTAAVQGAASAAGAETARSLWYQTLAGAAFAQRVVGASAISRRVVDTSGAVLAEETDRVGAVGQDAFAPLERSVTDILQATRSRAQALDAQVVSAHFIRLFGGTAELVVQPSDPTAFVASAGSKVASLLGDLGRDQRPYLVTVVDSVGRPLLVLGFTPGVGGTMGQGIGWQAPDVDSDAIWGRLDPSRALP